MGVMRHRPDIDAVLHGDPRSDEWRGFNAGVRAAWRAWEDAEPAGYQGAVEERDQALLYLRELRLRTGNPRAVERTMVAVREFLDRLGEQ